MAANAFTSSSVAAQELHWNWHQQCSSLGALLGPIISAQYPGRHAECSSITADQELC